MRLGMVFLVLKLGALGWVTRERSTARKPCRIVTIHVSWIRMGFCAKTPPNSLRIKPDCTHRKELSYLHT